ncbi:MAG TPA: LLM class F420-dependent oxidoreductase [Ktedonobacterales bacterium]|nr:LLM class F420-dependent oxidoreductase [Ktedonobacterales bacterium]
MATKHPLSFGIKTAPMHTTYEDMLVVWREADALPIFEHAWFFDHFMPIVGDSAGPCLEGWTLLAAYAAQTERLRVGLMVTGNTYRHPAVLANMGATVDIISRGRLDFGIGAGWNELEHTAYGIPLYKPGERIARFAEACEVIKLMWTEEAPDFDGRYYQLQGARCEPKPIQKPYPPFVIGGSGEQKTLRVVAQYADIWNFGGGSVEEFTHKSQVLDEHCAAIGRDPASIVRSVQYRVAPDGDFGAARDALRGYIEAGATHIVPYLTPPFAAGFARRVASEIAEPLHAEFADR